MQFLWKNDFFILAFFMSFMCVFIYFICGGFLGVGFKEFLLSLSFYFVLSVVFSDLGRPFFRSSKIAKSKFLKERKERIKNASEDVVVFFSMLSTVFIFCFALFSEAGELGFLLYFLAPAFLISILYYLSDFYSLCVLVSKNSVISGVIVLSVSFFMACFIEYVEMALVMDISDIFLVERDFAAMHVSNYLFYIRLFCVFVFLQIFIMCFPFFHYFFKFVFNKARGGELNDNLFLVYFFIFLSSSFLFRYSMHEVVVWFNDDLLVSFLREFHYDISHYERLGSDIDLKCLEGFDKARFYKANGLEYLFSVVKGSESSIVICHNI